LVSASSERRHSVEAFVRPLVVVADEPSVSQKPHLLDRLKHIQVEHFITVRPVEALTERVLIRLTRLDEAQLNITLTTSVFDCRGGELRTVVQTQAAGFPDSSINRSSTRIR
jgi:hypothetical protein